MALLQSILSFWHLLAFALGGMYVWLSWQALWGIVPYQASWTKYIRLLDHQLWFSGLALIGAGISQKGMMIYLDNPKLWAKCTVILVWTIAVFWMRAYAVPAMKKGNITPMRLCGGVHLSCWVYGAWLGVSHTLAYGVFSYIHFLSLFLAVIIFFTTFFQTFFQKRVLRSS